VRLEQAAQFANGEGDAGMTSDAHGQSPTGPEGPSGSGAHEEDARSRYAIRPQQWQQSGGQSDQWDPLPTQSHQPQPGATPKSPAIGVLLSVFVPGLGSMVNGNVGIGVTILILNIVGWFLVSALIGIPIAIGSWMWGMVDGYLSAKKWNSAHGISAG
jgi:TM2 domain-containing membrane protein YozV